MKIDIKNKSIYASIAALLVGLLLGWIFFGRSSGEEAITHDRQAEAHTIWTCSMHPQIRKDKPGQCPICGMDLISLNNETAGELTDPQAITMTPVAMKMANVETMIVSKAKSASVIKLNGKVQADERKVYSQAAHIPGRIEKLLVNFTGEPVRKGQTLAVIYSPDMVTAQQELFEAAKIKASQPELYEAAREKLRNWKLSDNQINSIEASGHAKETFEIKADVTGLVLNKKVNLGDYVMKGMPLFEVVDLSSVWVLFDAYETDLRSVNVGSVVKFTVQSLPGESFNGKVAFIDPVVDPTTRVASVRVEIKNSDLRLKPEMFVTGTITSSSRVNKNQLIVPKSAILWTGERGVVYVKDRQATQPSYRMREVTLGSASDDGYVVLSGLTEGEEIVVNGVFAVDASAQLAGKPSMMNEEGGKVSTGHDHGTMKDMPSSSESTAMSVNEKFKKQFTNLIDPYLKIKDALVASDGEGTSQASVKMSTSLQQIDMTLLTGDSHVEWMATLEEMNKSLEIIKSTKDLAAQRKSFADLSDALHHAIKQFQISGLHAYYQYCPMAFDNKGAYWLSRNKEIKNPYFGKQMLTCGENRETME